MEPDSAFSDNVCPICLKDLQVESYCTLGSKGLQTLTAAAVTYGHEMLFNYLSSFNGCDSIVNVHERCRKKYADKRELDKVAKRQHEVIKVFSPKKLRSASDTFNYKEHCLYCGCPLVSDAKNPGRGVLCSVRTIELHSTVMAICEARDFDEWSRQVSTRLQCCIDLVAEEARYHKSCHDRFHLHKSGPANAGDSVNSIHLSPHRPKDLFKQATFETLCTWLESQTELCLISVSQLRNQLLSDGYSDEEIYSVKSLKRHLKERYLDHVMFVEHAGQHDVVCLTNMASFVLRKQWRSENASENDDTERDSLNKLRFTTYMRLTSSSKKAILPEQLPPTTRAAYFHSLRTHMQVLEWKCLSTNVVNPLEWGWQLTNNVLEPIATDQQPAPDDLLKVVRCQCKSSSKNPCGSNLCSCRRNGLSCVSACSGCRGSECENCKKLSKNDEIEIDDLVYMDEAIYFEDEETVEEGYTALNCGSADLM